MSGKLPIFPLLFLACLAGCVRHMPPLGEDQTITISGRETVGLANDAAQRKVLTEAAQQTVDHGFRYFAILPGPAQRASIPGTASAGAAIPTVIGPGMDVHFRVLRSDQVRRGTAGLYDAYRLLNGKPSAARR